MSQQKIRCCCGDSQSDLGSAHRNGRGWPPIWRWPSIVVTAALIGLVRVYQLLLSPLLGGRCRFSPSCSVYAIAAFQKHGAIKGLARSGWRLLRCNPFCKGGYDPP